MLGTVLDVAAILFQPVVVTQLLILCSLVLGEAPPLGHMDLKQERKSDVCDYKLKKNLEPLFPPLKNIKINILYF